MYQVCVDDVYRLIDGWGAFHVLQCEESDLVQPIIEPRCLDNTTLTVIIIVSFVPISLYREVVCRRYRYCHRKGENQFEVIATPIKNAPGARSKSMSYNISLYYYYTTHKKWDTNISTHARKHVRESYRSCELANTHVCANDRVELVARIAHLW